MKRMLIAAVAGAWLMAGSGAWAQSALSPKCGSLIEASDGVGQTIVRYECWQELDDHPGCHVFRYSYVRGDYIAGTATCSDGLVKRGTLTIESVSGKIEEGRFAEGMRNGRWVHRYPSGSEHEGPYADGLQTGRWVFRDSNGRVEEGAIKTDVPYDPYLKPDGKGYRVGKWTILQSDGTRAEGRMERGDMEGKWKYRWHSGGCDWLIYDNGEEVDRYRC